MPKGVMTLEKLARMVQQGFTSVDQRFDRLEARMDSLESETSAVRRQIRRAIYEPEFVALDRRVISLERRAGLLAK